AHYRRRLEPPPRSTPLPYTTLFRSRGASTLSAAGVPNPASEPALRSIGSHLHQPIEGPARLLHLPVLEQRGAVVEQGGHVSRLRSEEDTSELQSRGHLVCRRQLAKK